MPMLVRITHLHRDGLPKDSAVTSFVFAGDATSAPARADAVDRVSSFWAGHVGPAGHLSVGAELSNEVLRAGGGTVCDIYDLAGHLDGSPHGSPLSTTTWNEDNANDAESLPGECAIVLSLKADLNGILEEGAEEEIPTPRAAIRMGAPETHLGRIRPKARRRGRVYIGPLNNNAGALTAIGVLKVHVDTQTVLKNAATALIGSSAGAAGAWSVWSRRSAALFPVIGGFIDEAFDTQRRRGVKSTARTLV